MTRWAGEFIVVNYRGIELRRIFIFAFVAAVFMACGCESAVRTGLDRAGSYQDMFKGKRVGIVTNHTARDARGRHIVDVFGAMADVKVTALFGPEHGIYGLEQAGVQIDSEAAADGPPIHSLYGKLRKPTAEMLADVDVLVFDIQDIGARFYTYIYTMALCMEAAAENGKAFVVLDRPNPINGVAIEGPILEARHASFVGKYPIAVRHAMTVGELARMFNGQLWLTGDVKADLTVVTMTGWARPMWYDQTSLPFIKPSPNMPDLATATVYPGLCLLEGTNISEGRGTDRPFLQFGAPWIDSDKLVQRLNRLSIAGVAFETVTFTPDSSKHSGQRCHGARITVLDRDSLEAFWCGVLLVDVIFELHPDQFEWRAEHFDRLCGTSTVREAIAGGGSLEQLRQSWRSQLQAFNSVRGEYLLYGRRSD